MVSAFLLHFTFLILPFHRLSLTLVCIVNTPNETTSRSQSPISTSEPLDHSQAQPLAHVTAVDPNNPPWGLPSGILTWVGSVALLYVVGIVVVLPYALTHIKGLDPEQVKQFLLTDKTAVFLQIFSAIPAHLLTLFIAWAVVTRFGKRPFWKTLGWSWSERFGFWKSAGLAVGLLLVGLGVSKLIGGEPTLIDQIVENSLASRYMLAFLAAASAPFIEELVYRGVLYSALHKTIGMVWAVVIVSVLFAAVHVLEYYNNVGVILVISILSVSLTLLRAYTGKLLPCYIVHLVFNGIQAILILIEPYLPHTAPDLEQKAPALTMLWHTVRPLL
ncbi:MAG: protease family protein [Acidobacteriota bacterium]|jgi:membrane protease YdiL (CAAX protease family)|nr:protease family protein [Acidobacteriota bacterium]